MSKRNISITILVLLIGGCISRFAFAGDVSLESVSYNLSTNTFTSAGIVTTSPVYQIYAGVQELPGVNLSSGDFISGTGFVKASYFMSAFGPTVLAIEPASGNNIAPIHIKKITGTNFTSSTVVKLQLSGETDITATGVNVVSATEIICDFDITGAKAGKWNVLVTKEGESGSLLTEGFEVKAYSFAANLAINYPNPFDPAREETKVFFRLDKDADTRAYIFTITGDMIWKDNFLSGSNGGRAGENTFTWNGMSAFGEMMSNGVYLLHIVEPSTGRTIAKGKIMVLRRTASVPKKDDIPLAAQIVIAVLLSGALLASGSGNIYRALKKIRKK